MTIIMPIVAIILLTLIGYAAISNELRCMKTLIVTYDVEEGDHRDFSSHMRAVRIMYFGSALVTIAAILAFYS